MRFELSRTAPLRRAAGPRRRDARQPAGSAPDQPDRRARARHPRRVPAGRAGRGGEARAADARTAAPTCARSISSPSIPSMRATTTMPSTPRPDRDPGNSGGWVVHVAIADVAHYVRPGTRLDREAQLRGNSVYFPDRVVPMLPERISNDLCSLQGAGGARPASPCASSSTSTATSGATPSCAP